MKIRSLMMMMVAAAAVVLGFSSCGSDDDDKSETPLASLLVGSYSGTETMTVMGEPDEGEKVFQITKATDSTVDMVIPAYGEGMMSLPALPVKGIQLAKNGDDIGGTLTTGSYSGSVKNDKGEEKNYTVTDFMVLYNSKEKAIVVTFKLKYGNMPFDFEGLFMGQKVLK